MIIKEHQYTNKLYHLKVLLIGVFPPPLGGIAIHTKRVGNVLKQQGCKVLLWPVLHSSLRYYADLILFSLKNRPQVIIYHTMQLRSAPIELFILLLMSKLLNSRYIVVIHSARFIVCMGPINGKITSLILKFCTQVILVGTQLKDELSAKITLGSNIAIESPFLPPDLNENDQILTQIPVSLKQFMSKHRRIITVLVTRLDLWQGQDLYGTDLAIQAFELILKDFPDTGLLIVLGNQNKQKLQLGSNTYLLNEWPYEMWPLIGESDLFIRPTRSDCNAISVMEAIYLNTLVIASDVCPRPNGTILFKSGDVQDLYLKMKIVLQDLNRNKIKQISTVCRNGTAINTINRN